jgi:hypothetical protein
VAAQIKSLWTMNCNKHLMLRSHARVISSITSWEKITMQMHVLKQDKTKISSTCASGRGQIRGPIQNIRLNYMNFNLSCMNFRRLWLKH